MSDQLGLLSTVLTYNIFNLRWVYWEIIYDKPKSIYTLHDLQLRKSYFYQVTSRTEQEGTDMDAASALYSRFLLFIHLAKTYCVLPVAALARARHLADLIYLTTTL